MLRSQLRQASLPVDNPTSSYWQLHKAEHLESVNSSPLPTSADVVIIGSGFTGALVALDLLRTLPNGTSVVMLEARAATSGATGRNGGHIKPDRYLNFAYYKSLIGAEEAVKQCHFEQENFLETVEFIRREGLVQDADLVTCGSADVFMTPTAYQKGLDALRDLQAAGGDTSAMEVWDSQAAQERFRINDACGAISFPAASLWPYKLVTSILDRAIALGLRLHTYTPVLAVKANSGSSSPLWDVVTRRGTISAPKVVHATNAYASALLPELTGKLVTLRGHAARITPSVEYTTKPLGNTCSLHWDDEFDYMIQRPNDGKPFVYGGCDLAAGKGIYVGVGTCDDAHVVPEIEQRLRSYCPNYMRGWQKDTEDVRQTTNDSSDMVWTGIMGLTPDEIPYVGAVPKRPGQYIAAGYCGHGMARILLSAKGLCQVIRGEEVDERIPKTFFDLEGRFATADALWKTHLRPDASTPGYASAMLA